MMMYHANVEWLSLPTLVRRESQWPEWLNALRRWIGSDTNDPVEADEGWDSCRCLYALTMPGGDGILYIGKAWSSSVRARVTAKDKKRVFDAIYEAYQLHKGDVEVMLGIVQPVTQRKLTHSLLAEIESLLIHHVEPVGNVAHTDSYTCREGLTVRCLGEWPLRQCTFVDEEAFDRLSRAD